MDTQQHVNTDNHLKTDMLAWRVLNAKRREARVTRNKEYNLRPRLRSEAHH